VVRAADFFEQGLSQAEVAKDLGVQEIWMPALREG
jgi:hypothetical protein